MSDASTADLLKQVLERMDRIEQRLDAIQGTTDGLSTLSHKAPVAVEAVASSLQFGFDQAVANGIDPVETSVAALEIAALAGQPESIQTVKRLLGHQALLNKTLDTVEKLDADGTLDVLVEHGATVAPRLAKVMQSPVFNGLLAKTLDDDKALATAEAATTALIETRTQGFQPLGMFGQIGALMNKDVQKAIGFTLEIAKRFGQKL